MDEHIQALEILPEPTKSLTINFAKSGSFADASALHQHILRMTTSPPLSYFHIVTTIFCFLDPRQIPDDMGVITEEMKLLVFRARLSLEILSHLAHLLQLNDQYYYGLASYIITHHDRVFSWLDFCQRHFFGRTNPNAAIDERRMRITLACILSAVSRVSNMLDCTKHSILGRMVIHIWHKLLRMESIYTRPDVFMMRIVLAVDYILPTYLHLQNIIHRNSPLPQYIIDAVGGSSAVIAFTLARMERDVLYITPELDGIDIPYVGIRGGFINLNCFVSSPVYGSELLEQRVITRSVHVMRQVIERGPPPSTDLISDPPPLPDQIIIACIGFLVCCPRFGPEAVREMLSSGLIHILRTRTLPLDVPLSFIAGSLQTVEFIPFLIVANLFYPSVIKDSKKHATSTPPMENCPLPDLWGLYDAYVSAYGYLWERAGNMARMFEKCTTCKRAGSDCRLKLCSGCRITKYCSSACQRVSWEKGHKINCIMFQCSHHEHRAIASCRDFLYLAFIEHFILQEPSVRSEIEAAIILVRRLSLSERDEIPVFSPSMAPHRRAVCLKRMDEFPEIFGMREWRRSLLPKFRQLVSTGRIKHLTIIKCPKGFDEAYILGPLASTMASGMVDSSGWDREAEHYESIRPKLWPDNGLQLDYIM